MGVWVSSVNEATREMGMRKVSGILVASLVSVSVSVGKVSIGQRSEERWLE